MAQSGQAGCNDQCVPDCNAKKEEEHLADFETRHRDEPPGARKPPETFGSQPDEKKAESIEKVSLSVTNTSDATRLEEIEEKIREVRETLNMCTEKAMIQVSQRQMELERWFKLAAAQGIRLEVPVAARTESFVQQASVPPTEEAGGNFHHCDSNSNDDSAEIKKVHSTSEECFPRLEITSSGFLQVKATPKSKDKAPKKTRKVSSLIKNVHDGAPRSASSKIDRIRKQEGEIRRILMGMKANIQPRGEPSPNSTNREPTINESLGLTEFYTTTT